MVAAANGRQEVVRLLIDAGADPNRVNKWGESALGLAAAFASEDVVDHLRARGAVEPTLANATKSRPPKLRWIADLLTANRAPVWAGREVEVSPVPKTWQNPDPPTGRIAISQVPSGGVVVGDPFSGGTYTVPGPPAGNFHIVGGGAYGEFVVATMIVEVDGTVSHTSVIDASSEEFRIAVDKVLDTFTFEPGLLGGQPVRTRIVMPVTMR
jgi:hypothetical protein